MIFIDKSLSSTPGSVAPGQAGTLRIGLSTDQSPSETAQIQYQIISPLGVVFDSTSSAFLNDSALVFSTGSTASTPYALRGGPGLVNIRATVTPAVPPATTATAVALTGALVGAAGTTRGGPAFSLPAPVPVRKNAALRKKAARKATPRKTAAAKKAAPKKAAGKKSAASKGTAAKRTAVGKRTKAKKTAAGMKTASKRKIAKGK